MISAKLVGGLGNQMWIIAAAEALAIRNSDIACFDLDSCYTPLQGYQSSKYKDSIFSNLKSSSISISEIYKEPAFHYTPIPYSGDIILDGYFQSEKYFQDFNSEISQLFNVPVVESFSKYTAVHVRRGDYLKSPDIHPFCGERYYLDAMSKIGGEFIIVSDDMEWCINKFGSSGVKFSMASEIQDLSLLKSCKNSIISNSSFSWWGAWLREKNNGGITIAPKQWFGPNGPAHNDIVPDRWQKL